MTDRISRIVSEIPETKVFGDIGCDHGYVANEMLKRGKCELAVVSDISAKCLKKAEDLLSPYVKEGKAIAIVSDGFSFLPHLDTALIAGMGGEEIISILKKAKELPEKIVLQPMKNTEKVRVFVVENGYRIEKDYVFYCGDKYYNLLTLQKGEDKLTEEETEFGRTNLKERSADFKKMLGEEIKKLLAFSENAPKQTAEELKRKAERLKKYVED